MVAKINDNIEKIVRQYQKCQEQQPEVISAPLHPWKWPSSSWNRIHVDHEGSFLNSTFLIIVDSHTEWVEIFQVPPISSTITIQCLQTTFAQFGLPQEIVSDNGSSFTSTDFQQFVKANGINHVVTAPYQPQGNDLAKCMVQTFKNSMKTCTNGTITYKLNRFLSQYRTTPHRTTGVTPAELMFGQTVNSAQAKQKSILIKGLKIEFSMRMILFMFVTIPDPQTLDRYLHRLKDKLEMYCMKLFCKIIAFLRDMSTN